MGSIRKTLETPIDRVVCEWIARLRTHRSLAVRTTASAVIAVGYGALFLFFLLLLAFTALLATSLWGFVGIVCGAILLGGLFYWESHRRRPFPPPSYEQGTDGCGCPVSPLTPTPARSSECALKLPVSVD